MTPYWLRGCMNVDVHRTSSEFIRICIDSWVELPDSMVRSYGASHQWSRSAEEFLYRYAKCSTQWFFDNYNYFFQISSGASCVLEFNCQTSIEQWRMPNDAATCMRGEQNWHWIHRSPICHISSNAIAFNWVSKWTAVIHTHNCSYLWTQTLRWNDTNEVKNPKWKEKKKTTERNNRNSP